MKMRILKTLVFLSIAISTLGVVVVTSFFDWREQYDLDLRYHEVCCSHDGIDPFEVWNRRVETPDYVGVPRPDLPSVEKSDSQHYVHAYPPWHTTFFYWYGWVPHGILSAVVRIANIALFLLLLLGMLLLSKDVGWGARLFVVASMCLWLFYHGVQVAIPGNYGTLIAVLLLAFFWALKRRYDTLAGVIWAVTLIKPQLTLLMFWPLVVQRRFMVIAVAALACIAATLWPAYLYGSSPIDLVLQIPKIGAPYVGSSSVYSPPALALLEGVFGSGAMFVLAAVCSCVCGVLSYMTRNCREWWMKAVPATVMIPYWTYTLPMNEIVTWSVPLLFLLASVGCFPDAVPRKYWKAMVVAWVFFMVAKVSLLLLHTVCVSETCVEKICASLVSASRLESFDGLVLAALGLVRFAMSVAVVVLAVRISSVERQDGVGCVRRGLASAL